MTIVASEQIVLLLGLAGIWAIWYYLWKPLRVDSFRETLFALRDELFDLAADGVVPFNDPAYTQLRLMINGMIRFAHRATFPTMIMARLCVPDATSASYAAWQKCVERLPEGARARLLAVRDGVFGAFAKKVVGGSPVLWVFIWLKFSLSAIRVVLLLILGRRDLDSFTVDRARLKVDWEEAQVTRAGARVIGAQVLYDEQKRTSVKVKDEHAYAH